MADQGNVQMNMEHLVKPEDRDAVRKIFIYIKMSQELIRKSSQSPKMGQFEH